MLVRSSLLLILALGVSGCGAVPIYHPANNPRVSVASDGIYKNGKRYPRLVDAVADNPRAVEEVRTAQSITTTANWLFLGSVGLDVAGVSLLVAGQNDAVRLGGGLGTIGAALALGIVAVAVGSHAGPHVLNAINIYNDDIEAKMCLKRPAPAPTGTPAIPLPEPAIEAPRGPLGPRR